MRHHRTIFLLAGLSASSGTVAQPAVAPDDQPIEVIEVLGTLGKLPGGLAQKRFAPNFVDAVTLEEFWRNPDEDVSEAAQRLPGVAVLGGEGRGTRNDFVSIRGIEPGLNNVTVNGVDVASSDGQRAVPLDGMASAMAGSLQIIKTVTPDMDANSIGGTINIETLNAFDRQQPLTLFSTSGGVTSDDDTFTDTDTPYRIEFAGTRRLGPAEAWGVALSASRKVEHFSNVFAQPDDWAEINGVFLPEGTRLENGETRRDRDSIAGRVDYRPAQGPSLFFEANYSDTDDEQRDTQTEWNFAEDPEAIVANPVDDPRGQFFSAEGENEKEFDISREEETIFNVMGGGEWDIGALVVELAGSYGRSELDFTEDEWSFDSANFSSFVDLQGRFPWGNPEDPAAFTDPGNFVFDEIDREPRKTEDETASGRIDVTFPLSFTTRESFIKTGFKVRSREVFNDNGEQQFEPPERNITLADFGLLGEAEDVKGFPIEPAIDAIDGPEFIDNNPDLLVFDPGGSTSNSLTDDFSIEEDVLAVYIMGLLDFGDLNLIAGVRVERTETDSNILEFIPGGPEIAFDESNIDEIVRPVSESNTYTEVLPNLQVRFAFRDDMQVRAAYTRTLGRPELRDLAGSSVLDLDITSIGGEEFIEAAKLRRGNPDLDPRISDNADLSFEWYPQHGGIVAVGAFYKSIDDPIFIQNIREFDVEVQGFEIPELDTRTPLNSSSGEAYGVELIVDMPLSFLQGPLAGLGVSGNLVVMDSEQDVPTRDDKLPLTLQPDVTANASVYYEYRALEIKLSYNYVDEYLLGVDRSSDFDVIVDDRFELDLHVSYEIFDGWRVFAQADNLTEEPFERFAGDASRPTFFETVPTTWWLGVRGEL